jgi:ferredoxin
MSLPDFRVETATVRFEPSGREVRVVQDSVLMDAVFQAALPLGQSCDGVALCGFCRVKVLAGLENLTPAHGEEQKILAAQHAAADERLACCARVLGPVTLTTDYW